MIDVHDRQPVVLSSELAYEWMASGTPIEHAEQLVLNLGEPSDTFEWYRVSKEVGKVRNQGPKLIEAVSEQHSQGDLEP